MRPVLLCSLLPLAIVGLSAPAAAFDPIGRSLTGKPVSTGVRIHRGPGGGDWDRHDRRDRRNRGNDGFAYYGDREYQGDTTWRADSFNDWWHSRPDRNLPRWVSSNQNCERMWWSGGGWRC